MKKVLIVRGVPGCGKTTYVTELASRLVLGDGSKVEVCSTDDYFKGPDGSYFYDQKRLSQAHQYCMRKFLLALLNQGRGLVVADNTFVHAWEYGNFQLAAKLAGWECEVYEFRVETVAQVRECYSRCRHGVPLDVIARMAAEFEPYPGAVVVPMAGSV